MTSAVTMLEAALQYASIGWAVFPLYGPRSPRVCSCSEGPRCENIAKHPRTRNGFHDATTEPAQIERWWGMWPKANIGIACGLSRIVVLDVDPRHGGDYQGVIEKYGEQMWETVSAVTGSGGAHYVFNAPADGSIHNINAAASPVLGPGIDVRGNGGYIVAAPSLHASGNRYEWEDDPFERKPAQLPFEVFELLSTKPMHVDDRGLISAADILAGVGEGERDWKLFQLASKLRYADVPKDWAYLLVEAAAAACRPPFPIEQARKKVDSAWRYEAGKAAVVTPLEDLSPDDTPGQRGLIDWAAFWQSDSRAEDWLIEPLLPRGRQIALFSPAKQGKSLLTLDVAVRAATGQRVFDQAAGAPLEVVYIDLEMSENDLMERLEDMGYGPQTDLSHLHYYLLPSLPPMDTEAGGARVAEIAAEHKADLVIIDTTSRVLSGPENDADTLRAYYIHTGLRLKAMGCTVWRLDHAGKNIESGQRGTSAKNDDVDLVWSLTSLEDGGLRLRATHRRQSWVPEVIEMLREADPLRHVRAAQTWPAGTAALAVTLDRIGIPLEWTNRKVRHALREAGDGARNETIAAAIKWRRIGAEKSGNTSGNAFSSESGNTSGNNDDLASGNALGNAGNTPNGNWGTYPPSKGGTSPTGPDQGQEEIDDGRDF